MGGREEIIRGTVTKSKYQLRRKKKKKGQHWGRGWRTKDNTHLHTNSQAKEEGGGLLPLLRTKVSMTTLCFGSRSEKAIPTS